MYYSYVFDSKSETKSLIEYKNSITKEYSLNDVITTSKCIIHNKAKSLVDFSVCFKGHFNTKEKVCTHIDIIVNEESKKYSSRKLKFYDPVIP